MVCFRSRNGDRAGFGFAPAARLAAPATREAAERSIHLAADIVSEESVATRGFTFLGFCFCFVCSYSCTGVMGLGWVAAVLVFLGPNPSFSCFSSAPIHSTPTPRNCLKHQSYPYLILPLLQLFLPPLHTLSFSLSLVAAPFPSPSLVLSFPFSSLVPAFPSPSCLRQVTHFLCYFLPPLYVHEITGNCVFVVYLECKSRKNSITKYQSLT